MIDISGKNIVGWSGIDSALSNAGSSNTFLAANPVSNSTLSPPFVEADEAVVDQALRKAEEAFDEYRQLCNSDRAEFLVAIGEELLALNDTLIERAHLETALPVARLQAERGRTINQLTAFAEYLNAGGWSDPHIDRSNGLKSDLRSRQIPIGPVGIFGASNFPLAFSVPGGDTASALAAGCPVVVKAHPFHPGTSELCGRAICRAAERCNMPDGVFSLLQGSGIEVGQAMVRHPLTKAIAFTGSHRGGRAIFDAASARPEPIPVYAEMGSNNPIFLMPGSLSERGDDIAADLSQSLMMGVGQFCTNPGMLVAQAGDELDSFINQLKKHLTDTAGGVMVHRSIADNYRRGVDRVSATGIESVMAEGAHATTGTTAQPAIFRVDAKGWLSKDQLKDEVFGPATIVISCDDMDELLTVARNLPGQLTATIHADKSEQDLLPPLIQILERKAGRILFNGFPTGVDVCAAMTHGGPYPATTDSRTTSVGTSAIRRFMRPVTYQDSPPALLPAEIQNENC